MTAIFQPLPEVCSILNELYKLAPCMLYSSGMGNLAMVLTHMLCFRQLNLSAIERLTLKYYSRSALSSFCHRSLPALDGLFLSSVKLILTKYPGRSMSVLIDDTDRPRSKVVKVLGYVFKTICKATGGYHNAQNIVLMCVVTPYVTIPAGFRFYRPDPVTKAWNDKKKKIKPCSQCKKGRRCDVCREKIKILGPQPVRSPQYKTRLELAVELLNDLKTLLDGLAENEIVYKVKSVIADAAYMGPSLASNVKGIFPKSAFISELRSNQLVCDASGNWKNIVDYFANISLTAESVDIRGKSTKIEYAAARLMIQSHGKKMHVVAMRYFGEKNLRYIVCDDLTWRSIDIIRHYGLRWLVEVVIEEWKQFSGFGKGASQYGEDGARCGVLLSLLGVCLFPLHPKQLQLMQSGQPLCTTASLSQRMTIDYFCNAFEHLLKQDDPNAGIEALKKGLDETLVLMPSKKHPSGTWYPDFVPSTGLHARYGERAQQQPG